MTFAPSAPLRALIAAAGVLGLALETVEEAAAAPPTAFRVSPRVMRRLRGTPRPIPVEPAAPETAAPRSPEPRVPQPEPTPAPESLSPQAPSAEAADAPGLAAPAAPASPGLFGPPTFLSRDADADAPADWAPQGANVTERPWRWIILHHTATDAGSVEAIHKAHRRRVDGDGVPWRGIGYHFVVGNGDGMDDGAVEPTFRWRDQLAGAHAGRRAENDRGIGVCLVGNFETDDPTAAQLAAARRLIAFLRARYDIPADRVLPHDAVSATACPGKRLSLASLLEEMPAPAAPASVPAPPAVDPAPPAFKPDPSAGPFVQDEFLPDGSLPDEDEEYLPTGLSAPEPQASPSLAAPPTSAPGERPSRLSLSPPRSRSQDAP